MHTHTYEFYAPRGYKAKEEFLEFLQVSPWKSTHEKHVLSLL